jgi:hypothetical protein
VHALGLNTPYPPYPPPHTHAPALARRSDAALLDFTTQRLRSNSAGLQATLRLGDGDLARLLHTDPTVLRASPELVRARYARLQELLQVGFGGARAGPQAGARPARRGLLARTCGRRAARCHRRSDASPTPPRPRPRAPPSAPQLSEASLRTFLLRAPAVLRLADGQVEAKLAWFQAAAGGIPRAKVVRSFLSWPQLATTSRAMLQDRCAAGAGRQGGPRVGLAHTTGCGALPRAKPGHRPNAANAALTPAPAARPRPPAAGSSRCSGCWARGPRTCTASWRCTPTCWRATRAR